MSFNALIVEKDDDGKTQASVQKMEGSSLPEGDVTIAVEYWHSGRNNSYAKQFPPIILIGF